MLIFTTYPLPLPIYNLECPKINSWTFVISAVYQRCHDAIFYAICYLFLYADDACLLFQHKDLEQIKEELAKNFSNMCYWFVDNKLIIHFEEDKTKSIRFSTKNKKKMELWTCNMVTSKSNNTQKEHI